MPTHRSITLSLISQYDARPLPETLAPIANRPPKRTITAHVPAHSSSQFWLSYACPLPPPAKPPNGAQTRYYYFKLFAGGRCVLSWGVGEAEEWRGKVVCGFWDAGTDFEGKRVVERRGLFFPPKKDGGLEEGGGFEVRVYRAQARKREEVAYQVFDGQAGGLRVQTVGRKKKGERMRFYTYALVDERETPFVTFRYVFRTMEGLRELDLEEDERAAVELSRQRLDVPVHKEGKTPSPSPRLGFDLCAAPPPGGNCFNISPGTPPSQWKMASNRLLRGVITSALRRKEDRVK